MNKTVLYNSLFGVLFGACFPLGAWTFDFIISEHAFTLSNISVIHSNNLLHWIIDLAPFVLGMMGYIIGIHRHRLEIYTQSLEQKITERTKQLSLVRDQAIEANNAKTQFLSNMSHELRTPLNAILGFSQLMQMDYKETHQSPSEDINHIIEAGKHLLNLIDDILDLTKVEVGAISISLEPVNIKMVVEECFQLSLTLSEKYKISLNTHGCEKSVVRADKQRLRQVLLNLITNAIKYNTQLGSVTVTCQKIENDIIRITVEDTGRGLDKQQQKKLFTAFERLGVEQEAIEGSGIGLVLSKKLIEEMNGSINFESQPGLGSRFWVELPRAASRATSREEPLDNITKKQIRSHQNNLKTVLYIEDNHSNLLVMEQIFKTCFPYLQLITATEPRSGLCIANELQPDLILLDINLPDMDGYEVNRQLKQSEVSRHIPVIAVSANAMTTDIEKGKAAGFVHYITKPIDTVILTKNINQILPEH